MIMQAFVHHHGTFMDAYIGCIDSAMPVCFGGLVCSSMGTLVLYSFLETQWGDHVH